MIFVIVISVFAILALIIFGVLFFGNKNSNVRTSKSIIELFEPDNVAPELGEMIDFHKKNGSIDYEV